MSAEYSPISRFNTFYDYVITGAVTVAVVGGIPAMILFTIDWLMS